MMEQLPEIEFFYIVKSYRLFEQKMKEMLFDEEAFLLSLMKTVFTEKDWLQIATESNVFGYCLITRKKSGNLNGCGLCNKEREIVNWNWNEARDICRFAVRRRIFNDEGSGYYFEQLAVRNNIR
ncbi:hypothetical protein [Oceanobacillus alkalisoli]|uniref:hypothetical protein n=1 Tax=Oceanobacillus alkalisoli TaxID=2925113 RepID=UPI001EE4A352|nr:hypothetical protein [Oceanobacillus alkalisoli]MCG5104113.1 hypothetical protein [Oceanobacillus alkalisoli]